MGRVDVVTKDYMSNNERFADVFNYYLYNGEKVIVPEGLTEKDARESVNILLNNEIITKEKYRDLLKHCILKDDGRNYYLILGIENQDYIHYAMPIKNMNYDAMNYASQASEKSKMHKKNKDISADEFLSGFSKDDKIKPVITLVVYFGADEWDAPRSLYDMFDIQDEKLLKYISDYKINLIVPKEISDTDKFSTDLQYVMEFIKDCKNRDKVQELLEKNREIFSEFPTDAAIVLKECANVDINIDEEKRRTNMCKGIQDMIDDARKEAREEERTKMAEGIQEMIDDAREETEKKTIIVLYMDHLLNQETVAERLNISVDKIPELVNVYGKK